MSKWSDFYKDRANDSYKSYVSKRYGPFIDTIKNYNFKTLAEFGCGIGTISSILNKKSILVDRDIDILKLAVENTKGRFEYTLGDITNIVIEHVDCIHSHGVLEHLDNESIRKTIALQKTLSSALIHYVPSDKYTNKSFGDERLMSPKEWYNICKPTRILSFNDGCDLILIWGNR